jgi:hypothetical protein
MDGLKVIYVAHMVKRSKRPVDRIGDALLALTIRMLGRLAELAPPKRRRTTAGAGRECGRRRLR